MGNKIKIPSTYRYFLIGILSYTLFLLFTSLIKLLFYLLKLFLYILSSAVVFILILNVLVNLTLNRPVIDENKIKIRMVNRFRTLTKENLNKIKLVCNLNSKAE
ncbi:hypothetical protein NEOKW01_1391 [Nematocida sp. AWRm80]|nr:hypothetical protein NEOKW01_1391 [Nematocida sp. AWRm80]